MFIQLTAFTQFKSRKKTKETIIMKLKHLILIHFFSDRIQINFKRFQNSKRKAFKQIRNSLPITYTVLFDVFGRSDSMYHPIHFAGSSKPPEPTNSIKNLHKLLTVVKVSMFCSSFSIHIENTFSELCFDSQRMI